MFNKEGIRKVIEYTAVVVFVAFWIGLIYFSIYYKTYRIPLSAMAPTVIPGDYVWGPKLTNANNLKRYDVVSYEYDSIPRLSRVLALPGDTVSFNEDARILINGKLIGSEAEILEPSSSALVKYVQEPLYKEVIKTKDVSFTIIYSKKDLLRIYGARENQLNNNEILIDKDQAYVVSDYRSNSMDSRIEGPIPLDSINSRITRIYFSWPSSFSEIKPRLKRVGTKLN